MLSNKGLIILLATIVTFVVISSYLRPAIDGILRKRLQMPGLVGSQFKKRYTLEGEAAFLMGCFLILLCAFFLIAWLWLIVSLFFS